MSSFDGTSESANSQHLTTVNTSYVIAGVTSNHVVEVSERIHARRNNKRMTVPGGGGSTIVTVDGPTGGARRYNIVRKKDAWWQCFSAVKYHQQRSHTTGRWTRVEQETGRGRLAVYML